MAYRMNIHHFSQYKKEKTPRKLSDSDLKTMKKYFLYTSSVKKNTPFFSFFCLSALKN